MSQAKKRQKEIYFAELLKTLVNSKSVHEGTEKQAYDDLAIQEIFCCNLTNDGSLNLNQNSRNKLFENIISVLNLTQKTNSS